MMSVTRNGKALPWYTYPCIDFLRNISYENKLVLEFGGGQSPFWWAERSEKVITLEGNKDWFDRLKSKMPSNVDLHNISMESPDVCTKEVLDIINTYDNFKFDIIIIDGLYRFEMIEVAIQARSKSGIIICDNAEGYGFYEGFNNRDLMRVDFFGYAPGVIYPHSTSIYFAPNSFVFSPANPISTN